MEVKEQKEFKEERFEFAVYVNNNVICKRNFKINNFIDGSMETIDFKYAIDGIVNMIDSDLKSKSRVYTWYYFDEEYKEPNEFNSELIEPWECTFKFVVTDNKREVISKIWDGRYYPKAIREKVDLSNKNVKITTKDGRVFTYDKESYFKDNEDRLTPEMYVLRAMISDKSDLLFAITKRICEVCSPREEFFQTIGDYTTSEVYKTPQVTGVDETTKIVSEDVSKLINKKKYSYSMNAINSKLIADWKKAVSEKTKKHNASLYL